MKNHKGQIDMFGLLIIIILLVVIALFSLFFMSGKEESSDVYSSLKIHNFANALSKATIGSSNMEALVSTCCSVRGGSCDSLLNFAEDEFKKLGFVDENLAKKKVKFELKCYFGYSDFRGECVEGTASETIILQSGDSLRVLLCD